MMILLERIEEVDLDALTKVINLSIDYLDF